MPMIPFEFTTQAVISAIMNGADYKYTFHPESGADKDWNWVDSLVSGHVVMRESDDNDLEAVKVFYIDSREVDGLTVPVVFRVC